MNPWEYHIKNFSNYLKIERSLAKNTVENYVRDVKKLANIFLEKDPIIISQKDISNFIFELNKLSVSIATQNRILSGIKSFYKFLILEDYIKDNPAILIESVRLQRVFPQVLSNKEIEKIIQIIDLSSPMGERNKAIIEVLYGCGLRVSELINLKISDLFLDEDFIKVIGKGNKQRLVPLGSYAKKQIIIYKNNVRNIQKIDPVYRDILFLNQNGRKLTRVMIFTIVKKIVVISGIKKNISPHSFRHSFATELVQRGADLRVVQEMLGHESITTTEIYTHIEKQDLKDSIIQFHPRSKF